MDTQTIALFNRTGVTPLEESPSPVAEAEIPARGALDRQLRDQRLRLIRLYSLGVAIFGSLWCAAYFWPSLAGGGMDLRMAVVSAHAGFLGLAGVLALYLCRLGHLQAATYLNVLALIGIATINLALIANAEGAGIITYCVAISIAALVVEGRQWIVLALVLTLAALAGALLHSFPVVEPVQLPRVLSVASLLVASTLGLAYPAGLFWLFSTNLTASRNEAWGLARAATDASRLIGERTRQLELRTVQLEGKNHELSDFLYVVSHDLRAPLINLEGFSRALEESVDSLDKALAGGGNGNGKGPAAHGASPPGWPKLREDITESLDFILRSVAKMDFLVRGLLELSRIDSRPQLSQPINLDRVVEEILGSLHYNISERGIRVDVDPLPTVIGDPMRINQVFGNLIDNAVKYMKPEGEARIQIGHRREDDLDCFFVRDSGIGIRPEDHAKIFRLFTRIAGSAAAGDGLGLTAVKKILERHGGRIWVESEPGEGSTFWFTLPGAASEEKTDGHAAQRID